MQKHLIVGLALSALLVGGTALADHRPGNVVVVGGTVSLTGRSVEPAGRIHNARKLFVDELNARGGLLGHRVELKILDDKSKKRIAIELYEKLITEDKVDLVLGPYSSRISDPVANVLERFKQPFIAHGSNPKIWQRGRKYVFALPKTFGPDYHKGALYLASKIGVIRIGIIVRATTTDLQKFVGAQEWAKKLGLKVVLSERYRKDETEFRAFLRKIEASGAEAIFSIGKYPDTVAQVRQLRELNINVKMFAALIAPALPKFVEELGSLAEYVVGFSQWEPKPVLGYPGIAEFIENYEKRYGVKPNYHASNGYTEMQIFTAAVRRASSFDPKKVRDAMSSIRVDTIRGPWKANEQGISAPIEGVAFQIQNGKRLIMWPEYAAEAKFLPMPKWEDRAKK